MTTQPQIRRPLDGMLVLDLGQIYNGPYCGLQLAFMGARVLKIEPPEGDVVRRRKREVEPYPLVMLNSNKESVVLDFKQPRGKELFLALVEKADVLIENFAAGVMDRLGLGYDVLSKLNPRLVYGGSSGFGLDGPYRDLAAMDVTIQAMSGITNATGDADGPPTKAGAAVCDFLAGIHLCAGILGALVQRERTGKGQRVEVAMHEAGAGWWQADIAQDLLHSLKVCHRFCTKVVEQFRRTNDHLLHRRVLAIENTQRIRVETTFCFFIEQIDVFFEISNQLCTMTSAFVQLPKRIQLQLDAVQSKVIPKTGAHQNLLGVNIGAGIAEGLDADLIELAITPFLWPLMAEHLPHVIQALRMLCC